MVKLQFKQEYSIDENGYPKDLPRLEVFVGPPYIMPYLEDNGITVHYQEDDSLDDAHKWAIKFYLLINSHFATFHSNDVGDESEIISLALEECEALFNVFMFNVKNIKHYSFSLADHQAKMWVEATKSIAWSAFKNNIFSSDSLKKRRSTARLFKSIELKLDELYDSFYELSLDGPYNGLDKCVMFNLWGKDYPSMRNEISAEEIRTSIDREIVDIKDNKTAFYKKIERILIEAAETRQERLFENKVMSLCRDIEKMFVDYMRHYRKQKILDQIIIERICEHWRIVAISIIHRAYAVLSAEYAVDILKGRKDKLTPCLDGEELYAHEKRAIIVEKVTETINDICKRYQEGYNIQSWTTKIDFLEINFDQLYLAMKDKYFSGISRNDFEYAIRNADFHEIITSAKSKGTRSGISGCVYFFVSELGDNLGNEWLYKAAESCTQKEATKAVAYIRSHSNTESQKEFSGILKQYITNYKPRKKSKRKKQ